MNCGVNYIDVLTRKYNRNAAGRITCILGPNGFTTDYQHDAVGRVTEIAYHTGEKEQYEYFPSGLLKSATNTTAKVEFERDVFGNVVKEICNGESISSSYDQVGRWTGLTSSLGANIQYEFDTQSNVTSMRAASSETSWKADIKYGKLGLEIERLLPGNLSSKWKRDELGRPVEQRLVNGKSLKHQRRYKWGINDRLHEILDSVSGATKFTHDERGYLTGAKYSNATTQLRNPDEVGNLFETKNRTDRKYGDGGRLLKKGSIIYEYDLEGNLIRKKMPKGSWHYEWNPSGMLEKVIRPDKEEVTFGYDALGRRLFKQFKRTITNFVWDGNVPLHEFKTFDFKEGEVDQLITWIFEKDSFIPAAKIKNGKEYSIQADHLGTPNRVFDIEGGLIWNLVLDSYGQERMLKGEKGACPFRYQGQYCDWETGLYYNRFRYYNAADGRYVSQDPIRISGGISLYSYVENPTRQIDTLGLATYTQGSRSHVYSHGHSANSPLVANKSRFRPTEGGQKFTDEITNHPNVVSTNQNNGRIKHQVGDLGRVTGFDQNGNPVRGGTVIEEGPNPASWSNSQSGEVVTQYPT